ncbi:MAG: WbqC family protein [Flavobacteriaceae bacterium]|nr:WbqC family protein [Flavobacteriaceae bacterium]
MLFLPTYFAPISQYIALFQNESFVFEVEDNFQKQTFRNRCYIYAANGKLQLNVPIIRTKGMGPQKTKDIHIDNSYPWQNQQLKTLQSAYRSSPYFEFYEDDLLPLFETKQEYLQDFNLKCHAFIMDAIQENIPFTKTTEYLKEPELKDARNLAIPKYNLNTELKSYTQVFDNKHGFIPNLSILDLLFMEGPNAVTYLQDQNISI